MTATAGGAVILPDSPGGSVLGTTEPLYEHFGAGKTSPELLRIIDALRHDRRGAAKYALDVFLEQHPDDPLALEIKGTIALEEGNLDPAEAAFQRVLHLQPDNNTALAKLGVVRLRKGQTAVGYDLLQQSYDRDPSELYALMNLAPLELSLGNVAKAVAHYRELIARQPDGGRAVSPFHIQLAQIYNRQAQYQATRALLAGKITDQTPREGKIEALTASIVASVGLRDGDTADSQLHTLSALVDRDDPRYAVAHAAVLNLKGKYDEAVRTLEASIAQAPEKRVALYRDLARVHLANHASDKAAQAYRKLLSAVKLGSDATRILRELMDVAMRNRSPRIAMGPMQEFAKRFPDQPMIGVMLATLHAASGDGDRALAVLSDLESHHPKFAETFNLKARLLFARGKRRQAIAAMQHATELLPHDIGYWMALSDMAHSVGGHAMVAQVMKDALAANPGDPDLLYDVALVDDEEGRKDAANRKYRKILKRNPDHLATLISLAKNLAGSREMIEEARQLIGHALQIQPDNPNIKLEYAWILHRGKDNEAALAIMESLGNVAQRNPIYFYRLAKIQQALNRPSAAASAARKALSLGLSGSVAREMQAMIR